MTKGITFQTKVHFRAGRNGRKHLETGETPAPQVEPGRVPRVSRMMALAIRFDGLIREGVVTDQAELARLGHVTRARVTQIMNLLQLAPEFRKIAVFAPESSGARSRSKNVSCGRSPLCPTGGSSGKHGPIPDRYWGCFEIGTALAN